MTIYEIWHKVRDNHILGKANKYTVNRCIPDEALTVREMVPGEEICSPEHHEEHVVVLLDGRAVVTSADGARNVRLRSVEPNSMFGIATLFSQTDTFPTRIYAATKCSVLFIEAEAFRRVILEDKEANAAFLRFLCERVVYLNKKIEGFTAGSAERRLALFLADNDVDGVFTVEGSYAALAQTLDVGRASLYRALETLETEGWIEKKDRIIYLRNKLAMMEKYSRG